MTSRNVASELSVPVRARPRSIGFWASAVFLCLVALLACTATFLPIAEPNDVDFGASLDGPSTAHPLGADQNGRDVLSRVIHGARVSLLGPLAILAVACLIGPALGLLAAWRGGWADTVISRLTDITFAFPALLFAVLVVAVLGKGIWPAVLALGVAFFPSIAKLSRNVALSEKSKPYIDVYRTQGMGGIRICLLCLLPNIAPVILGYVIVLFGEALLSLAGLSFLGFGAQPPTSEWGLMVSEGQLLILQGTTLPSLAPGVAIALTAVAFNVVGVRIADQIGLGRA